jgi:hypothetical protein
VAFLFSRDPAVADYPMGWGNTTPSSSWFKPDFPSGYVADVLQTLEVLAALGHGPDPRLAHALAWLEGDQDRQDRWPNRYAHNHKTWVDEAIRRRLQMPVGPGGMPGPVHNEPVMVTVRACSCGVGQLVGSGWYRPSTRSGLVPLGAIALMVRWAVRGWSG